MYETLIEAQDVHSRLHDPDWVVVDCRYDLGDPGAGYRAYLEGHIPGAVYAHLHDDLSGPPVTDHGRHPLPSPERMVELFSGLGIDERVQVVVYDDAGASFAARLWWMLRYMGHRAAAALDGGWQAWLGAGFAVEEGEAQRRPRRFSGEPARDRLVTVDNVASASCLVDSRDPARYRGETEPVDRVAGHIPGARNYFWKNNVDADGRFRSAAGIRRGLSAVLEDTDTSAAVFYCGSGVSACQNVLAAVYAGLPMPRLYVGSWSEWSADPDRPVAIGDGDAGCRGGD